jgi:DNA-3-methyladenine glycosylase
VSSPGETSFYARSVHDVARGLVGCEVRHGGAAGRIVEVESYHEEEPACHAHVGLTPRTAVLLGPPGNVYVYRSYGVHALLNLVAEEDGVGAAVLVRALEPIEGEAAMQRRRGPRPTRDLCSGPGKLTQALGIWLDLNGAPVEGGPIEIAAPTPGARPPVIVSGTRIGITRAMDLPWRFCDATSDCVSRPWPASMRNGGGRRTSRRRAA